MYFQGCPDEGLLVFIAAGLVCSPRHTCQPSLAAAALRARTHIPSVSRSPNSAPLPHFRLACCSLRYNGLKSASSLPGDQHPPPELADAPQRAVRQCAGAAAAPCPSCVLWRSCVHRSAGSSCRACPVRHSARWASRASCWCWCSIQGHAREHASPQQRGYERHNTASWAIFPGVLTIRCGPLLETATRIATAQPAAAAPTFLGVKPHRQPN